MPPPPAAVPLPGGAELNKRRTEWCCCDTHIVRQTTSIDRSNAPRWSSCCRRRRPSQKIADPALHRPSNKRSSVVGAFLSPPPHHPRAYAPLSSSHPIPSLQPPSSPPTTRLLGGLQTPGAAREPPRRRRRSRRRPMMIHLYRSSSGKSASRRTKAPLPEDGGSEQNDEACQT